MNSFTLVVIIVLGGAILATTYSRSRPPGRRAMAFFLVLAITLALIRVAGLWYIGYREWSGTQSLDLILIALLLYPEGLLIPGTMVWTVPKAILFSAVLTIGSFILAGILTGLGLLLARFFRRAETKALLRH